jgi:beta-mannosidase
LSITHGYSQSILKSHKSAKDQISLNSGWEFRQSGSKSWYPATVPGCVHTDLLANRLIGDPFLRDDEQRLQWIGKTDWEYQTSFEVTADLLDRQNIELDFQGLDTYAEVFLNGQLLLKADNMFREWRRDCKNELKLGANTLRIVFRSPINEVLPVLSGLKYQLPASNDQGEKTSPYTRKAPYQFGWDWGPRFVTSGIWKPIVLEAWDDVRISDFHVIQRELNKDVALLTAEVEIVSNSSTAIKLTVANVTGKATAASREITLTPGTNRVLTEFEIRHPSLWWPNGMGAHPLYELQARLLKGSRLVDVASTRIGLRTVELQQNNDRWGKSFQFVVNGVPVFAKGANWIPADSFPTRITKEKYRWLVESARDANMNMLRVWGGGIYESQDFYNLCDEMGILVWQEFMFACSMYPGDEAFLNNVRQEAIDNVKRLRNHPSIVLWCGNNEIETAWFNWGWKGTLPAVVWDNYNKLFNGVLPEVCASLDPSRPYWPSSPGPNLGTASELQKTGDEHYWGVWHASLPFSDYEKQFPRFMSEYGFQSFPQSVTVNTFTNAEDHDIQSPVMLAHQRHPRGNQLIREYMLREFHEPRDFESFLYVSQVLQAEGIKVGAEHLRRIMPRNMGSLYWQIDDCWPVASWSSVDYLGNWKALHYYVRRFYNELLVSPHQEDGEIKIDIVSDRLSSTPAQLEISLVDFHGRTLQAIKRDVEVPSQTSKTFLSLSTTELLAGKIPGDVFLHCDLLVNGKSVSENNYFFQPFKNMSLEQPQISTVVTRNRQGYLVTLGAEAFAKDVYLSSDGIPGFFSDNYFDLLPGRKTAVQFRTRKPISLKYFQDRLKVRSLIDAF